MKCYKPILITKNLDVKEYPQGLVVPCGKCIACREQKTREYVIRFKNEALSYKHTAFITLTYDDKNCPSDYSISKKEMVDYIKRVRKETGGKEAYYMSGEYGEQGSRPHYHIVIATDNKNDIEVYKNKWAKGRVQAEESDIRSIYYTIGYVDKKILGFEKYGDREAPFRKFSKGLGRRWLECNKEQIAKNLYILEQGNKLGLPMYYKKKLKEWGLITKEQLQELAKEENKKMLEYYYQKYGKGEKEYYGEEIANKEVVEIQKEVLNQRRRDYERKYNNKKSRRNKI